MRRAGTSVGWSERRRRRTARFLRFRAGLFTPTLVFLGRTERARRSTTARRVPGGWSATRARDDRRALTLDTPSRMKDEPDVSFAPRSPPNLRRVRLKPATDKARRPGRRGDASSGDARALSPPRDASESAEESLGSPPDPPRFARVSQGSAFETQDDRVEWDACHDSDFDFDSAQTLRRSDPPPAPPPRCPRPDPTAVPPAASLPTPDDATCEHCAELAARCAAADAAARHLSATLNRLRSTLGAVGSPSRRDRLRTSRAASDTSTRSKVNSTRTAMLCDGSRPYPPEIPSNTRRRERNTNGARSRTGAGAGAGSGENARRTLWACIRCTAGRGTRRIFPGSSQRLSRGMSRGREGADSGAHAGTTGTNAGCRRAGRDRASRIFSRGGIFLKLVRESFTTRSRRSGVARAAWFPGHNARALTRATHHDAQGDRGSSARGHAAPRALRVGRRPTRILRPEVDRITTGAAMGFSTAVGPTSRAPVRWLPAGASAAMRTFQARPYAAAAAPPTPPNAPTPNAKLQDEFISGTSAAYLESLEDKFREDPNSVPASWAAFLRQMGASRDPGPISRHPHERIARGKRSPTPRAPRPPLAASPKK